MKNILTYKRASKMCFHKHKLLKNLMCLQTNIQNFSAEETKLKQSCIVSFVC